jgi:hypothetical protein
VGAAGQTGAAGQGGAGGGDLEAACAASARLNGVLVPIGLAEPADFSADSQTGAHHEHELVILRKDYFDNVTMYQTQGTADHQHPVTLTSEQLQSFAASKTVTVTSGPADGIAGGHTHVIMIQPCFLPAGG